MPEKPSRIRPIAWGLCLIILVLICVVWSSLPTLSSAPLLRVALFCCAGFAMLGMVFLFPKISDRRAIWLIVIPAILLRILLLPAPLSDDVNRYLWEGQLVLSGENPYLATADDPLWESRRDATWAGMNHRDRPTAYPPGIQGIMAVTAAIHPALFSFKILALLGDLIAGFLLLKLLLENSAPLRWLGFYAFNPIVLISFAAEGHFDSLMIAAMLAAVLSASRGKSTAWIWLGVAIQIKLICLVLVPLFFVGKIRRSSYLLVLILIVPGLPFLSALPQWLDGVRQFAGDSAFNAPFFTLLASTALGLGIVKILCSTAFGFAALATCIARWRGFPLIDSCLWMLGALLAFSPIVHFWYLAWLLPLVALRPSFAWCTLSITMAGYFLAWHTQEIHGWWGFGHATAAIIWLPWLLAGLAQNRFFFARFFKLPASTVRLKSLTEEPRLAIIIPVLKPDSTLENLLQKLRAEIGIVPEIIISASEKTSDISLPEGSRILLAPRGRGNQIAAAIATTRAEWLLVVHADTVPLPGFFLHLETAILDRPDAAMFVFGQRFDRSSVGTLIIEALNEIRVVFGGVAFGDQTQLIRRSALESCGGFPAQPLMEDVEVSMRLATAGEIVYLGREWTVSAQKWQRKFSTRFYLVLKLVSNYQLARLRSRAHASAVSVKMYREYYPENKSQGKDR